MFLISPIIFAGLSIDFVDSEMISPIAASLRPCSLQPRPQKCSVRRSSGFATSDFFNPESLSNSPAGEFASRRLAVARQLRRNLLRHAQAFVEQKSRVRDEVDELATTVKNAATRWDVRRDDDTKLLRITLRC